MSTHPARRLLHFQRMKMPSAGKLTWFGAVGTVITALCCFTPLLVIVLSAIGLGALVQSLDAVLLPLLGVFVVILGVGLTMLGKIRAGATRNN